MSLYKSKISNANDNRAGQISEENETLKQQMSDMRRMFDVTISQTQDECSGYLATIEQLRQQVCAPALSYNTISTQGVLSS